MLDLRHALGPDLDHVLPVAGSDHQGMASRSSATLDINATDFDFIGRIYPKKRGRRLHLPRSSRCQLFGQKVDEAQKAATRRRRI